MLKEAIERILQEYPAACDEEFTDHPFAAWIRHDLPPVFAAVTPEYPDLIWVASAGQGQWADAPWVAAFDPLVTETAQEGYYPVYLFTRSLDAVYLSLNQGMAHLREELGIEAKCTLAHRASIIRTRLSPAYEARFSERRINLHSASSQTRLAFYEAGYAFGVRYLCNHIPAEHVLVEDLLEMLRLYSLATVLGGTQELDTTGHAVADQEQEYLANASIEEKRKLRFHLRVERNPKLSRLAKEAHGYVCEVCGFAFERQYGELGRGYIEAHHITPLAELPPNHPVRLSPKKDFAVLCANCHRMIHRPGAPATFAEFCKLHSVTRS